MNPDELWGQAEARRYSQEQEEAGPERCSLRGRTGCAWSSGQSNRTTVPWFSVYQLAQGTASNDGQFCLPVAKDAARACTSLKKLSLHIFSHC